MNTVSGALSLLRRLSIVIAIAILFVFGLASTVYLSLRSPEVRVPDVIGKDRFEAERVLGQAGLNFRVRATRPSSEVQADSVLFQVPRAGEVVKAGQTVAMDISRSVKEGETSEAVAPEKKPDEKTENKNTNEAAAANENKPKRNKNTNKNANENSNANRNLNANRNSNANRPPANRNANSGSNSNKTLNANRPSLIINGNSRSTGNQNEERRPPAPKPAATAKPTP